MKQPQNRKHLKAFLDENVDFFNRPSFIECDPISIPHLFTKKEDIEIAGFLAATIAWGNRKMILRNARRIMSMMDHAPYDFILHAALSDFAYVEGFIHRTFHSDDLVYFFESLKNIYLHRGGLEAIFTGNQEGNTLQPALHILHDIFFELPHKKRTERHVADPFKGSAAKRLNMFLRWMVRKDDRGVDFGLWKNVSPSILSCPLDVHSGKIARELGLLKRRQNDASAVAELDAVLRSFDPDDPVRYDFALFGLGAMEKRKKDAIPGCAFTDTTDFV